MKTPCENRAFFVSTKKEWFIFFLVKLVSFFFGTYLCFSLHHYFNVPVVLAAAFTGLVGSFWHWHKKYGNHPQAAIYAGAFAGMCSSAIITGWEALLFISVVGAGVYTLTRNIFEGFGGRLGAVAFTAVSSLILLRALF